MDHPLSASQAWCRGIGPSTPVECVHPGSLRPHGDPRNMIKGENGSAFQAIQTQTKSRQPGHWNDTMDDRRPAVVAVVAVFQALSWVSVAVRLCVRHLLNGRRLGWDDCVFSGSRSTTLAMLLTDCRPVLISVAMVPVVAQAVLQLLGNVISSLLSSAPVSLSPNRSSLTILTRSNKARPRNSHLQCGLEWSHDNGPPNLVVWGTSLPFPTPAQALQ